MRSRWRIDVRGHTYFARVLASARKRTVAIPPMHELTELGPAGLRRLDLGSFTFLHIGLQWPKQSFPSLAPSRQSGRMDKEFCDGTGQTGNRQRGQPSPSYSTRWSTIWSRMRERQCTSSIAMASTCSAWCWIRRRSPMPAAFSGGGTRSRSTRPKISPSRCRWSIWDWRAEDWRMAERSAIPPPPAPFSGSRQLFQL